MDYLGINPPPRLVTAMKRAAPGSYAYVYSDGLAAFIASRPSPLYAGLSHDLEEPVFVPHIIPGVVTFTVDPSRNADPLPPIARIMVRDLRILLAGLKRVSVYPNSLVVPFADDRVSAARVEFHIPRGPVIPLYAWPFVSPEVSLELDPTVSVSSSASITSTVRTHLASGGYILYSQKCPKCRRVYDLDKDSRRLPPDSHPTETCPFCLMFR